MATTPDTSEFVRYELETEFQDDYLIHTSYRTGTGAQRRIATKVKWMEVKPLGSGGYGVVSLQRNEVGELRAVKRLPLGMRSVDYSRELKALSSVSDRNDLFVKFLGWYKNSYCVFIAMEYVAYGDLDHYIKADARVARSNAREITKQLLKGLAVLHERKICHRDLKPHLTSYLNVLIAAPYPIWVKIADFGVSKHLKATNLHTSLGTPGYIAPEIIGLLSRQPGSNQYTMAVDLWALGCVVYQILTSQIPFVATTVMSDFTSGLCTVSESPQTDIAMLQLFCLGKIPFPVEPLNASQIRPEAIEFVKSLLVANPKDRSTIANALTSPWLTGSNSGYQSQDKNVIPMTGKLPSHGQYEIYSPAQANPNTTEMDYAGRTGNAPVAARLNQMRFSQPQPELQPNPTKLLSGHQTRSTAPYEIAHDNHMSNGKIRYERHHSDYQSPKIVANSPIASGQAGSTQGIAPPSPAIRRQRVATGHYGIIQFPSFNSASFYDRYRNRKNIERRWVMKGAKIVWLITMGTELRPHEFETTLWRKLEKPAEWVDFIVFSTSHNQPELLDDAVSLVGPLSLSLSPNEKSHTLYQVTVPPHQLKYSVITKITEKGLQFRLKVLDIDRERKHIDWFNG